MKHSPALGKCDQCMNFPELQWCKCREGLHALPQTMFDLFSSKSAVVFFHIGWDIFLREGMKPSPAPGKCTINV